MKEIVNIAYHNTNDRSLDSLRNLVIQFTERGYEVMITSHSSIPQDLIEKCACYFYDNKNVLADMSSGIIYSIDTDIFTIYSPYIVYGWVWEKSYCPAGNKNLLNSINTAYQLGYDILHTIEYDVVPQFEEYLDNVQLISQGKYDCILYGNEPFIDGGYLCLKLNEYHTRWDFDTFYKKTIQLEGICEKLAEYQLSSWVGQDRILKKPLSLAGEKKISFTDGRPDIFLYENGEEVFMFMYNNLKGTIKDIVCYFSGGKIHIDELHNRVFIYDFISKKDQNFFFDVFLGEKKIISWEINSPQSYQKIVGRNKINWK